MRNAGACHIATNMHIMLQRDRGMVGGCMSTKENLFSCTVKEVGTTKEKERAISRIVFQGVVCCIVTCFDCSVRTQFPLNRIQRKNLGVCKHRNRGRKTGRTAELHNKWRQHGSYQRGAPGLLQVTE